MNASKDWLKASWQAGRDMLRASAGQPHRPDGRSASMVPIRSLGPASDEQVRRYAMQLDFERDDIFGIYNRRLELIAMAHLAFASHPEHKSCAEFGVSVLKQARGRGYGGRLFNRAVIHARTKGVSMMFIHALSENTAMLKIARKAGATIKRDGSESEAYLQLPPAGIDTHMASLMTEHIGEVDYQLKKQAKQFWDFLADVQEIRRGVQDGRHQAGE
jgi:GNAT superfamily N-acetyltransferase